MRFIARHEGSEKTVDVERQGSGYRVRFDGGDWLAVDLTPAGQHVHSLRLEDGAQFGLTHHRTGNAHEITLSGSKVIVEIVDPLALKRKSAGDSEGEAGVLNALMPGRIVKVHVSKGDEVQRGTPLLVLEAMKMENEIQAPTDGTVDDVFVKAGDTVEAGAPLLHIG